MAEWGDETGMPQIGSSMPRCVAERRCNSGCHASLASARQTSTVVDESLNAVRLDMFSQSKRGVRAPRCTRLSQGSPRFVFGSPVSTVLDKTCERPLHLFWSRGTHNAVLASSLKEDHFASSAVPPYISVLGSHLSSSFGCGPRAATQDTHDRGWRNRPYRPTTPAGRSDSPRHRVWSGEIKVGARLRMS